MDWNDAWAKDKSQSLSAGPSTASRLRIMLPLLERYSKPGDSLLDAGCGTGILLSAVAGLGKLGQLSGFDISDLPLQRARQACPQAKLQIADVCAAPLPEQFDLVTCMMMLDLVPDDQRAAENLSQMVKPGGYFFTVVQHLAEHRTSLDDHYEVRRHDRGSLSALLQPHGLEPVELFAWGFPIYNTYYRALERSSAGDPSESRIPLPAMRLATLGLVQVFRFDDLFKWTARGRVLFGVFQKRKA